MKLANWRKHKGLTQEQVALALGVAPPTVSSWEIGGKRPGAVSMRRIFDLTEGAVTANDFYDLPKQDDAA